MSAQLIVPSSEIALPALIERAGKPTLVRFAEFFTAHISNSNTRQAYARAVKSFLAWCEQHGVSEITAIQPLHVAGYREVLRQEGYSVPTVKQHLAAVRELFDWLVTGHILPVNPASSVRGPRYSVSRGATPVLSADQTSELLQSIDTAAPVGLRDRALLALMTYTFARVGAAVQMRVADYFSHKGRYWVRLHEKNGKITEVPCHHNLKAYLDQYIRGAGLNKDKSGPLFRSAAGRTRRLSTHAMNRFDVYQMIRRRAKAAGIDGSIGCHTFRATGITAYLTNGGKLEIAQRLAGHANAKTTGLYDRRSDAVSADEVERIAI
jgi:site-specific recombinase XerD